MGDFAEWLQKDKVTRSYDLQLTEEEANFISKCLMWKFEEIGRAKNDLENFGRNKCDVQNQLDLFDRQKRLVGKVINELETDLDFPRVFEKIKIKVELF